MGNCNEKYIDDQKPVEVDKEYLVHIIEISRKGYGVAKYGEFPIFVEDGKIDDYVRVRIKDVARRFAVADLVK